ncbi:SphA family protein [Taklimakanibacter deserti]|uniref:SphA family protein n=1 Tax=Taklimakanibacter deserti TaxID=2267839 RepID=UPI000E650566
MTRSAAAKGSAKRLLWGASAMVMVLWNSAAQKAVADEGGVSFWLPGQYGSLAALPGNPGWTFTSLYYHTEPEAGGGAEFAHGGEIRAGLAARGDLVALGPGYIFEEPVLGGQFALSLLGIVGNSKASIEATLTGPNGNEISGKREESLFSYGDLFPSATLKWNHGTSNYMLYLAGDIPVGDYDPDRLANLGIGHGAIDGGVGYTYFNPETGHEFSFVTGLTYNFENEHTDYQNGIDWHLDWGASQFLSRTAHLGVVGYAYQQITGDSGDGAVLGDFESRVFGVGPQVGFLFPAFGMQAYLNIKGYYEFEAENRAEGWNAFVTFALSQAKHEEPNVK